MSWPQPSVEPLAVGGVIAGLAGVCDALQQSGVGSENFEPQVTFFVWAALILGGLATAVGPVVGAMLFWFLREGVESFIREFSGQAWLPDALSGFLDGSEGAISVALMGVGLVAMMALRPQGIFGRRRDLHLGT